MRVLIFVAAALAACAPPLEPEDASTTDASASDARDGTVDSQAPRDSAPDVLDATAPSDTGVPMDAPDDRPDPRDAGSDARDATPDVVCPADGFGGYEWRSCYGQICCPVGRCQLDINDRPFCQG